MNITFLIGNGFDLAAGLDTKFSQFTDYYIAEVVNNKELMDFKKQIRSEYNEWSKAEEWMGNIAGRCESEEELDKFCSNMRDYKTKLAEYLKKEQSFVTDEKIAETELDFIRGLEKFYKDFDGIESEIIKKRITTSSNTYNFIDFNYTNIIDRYIEHINEDGSELNHRDDNNRLWHDNIGENIHIHGTVYRNLIMGVNDISQIDSTRKLNDKQRIALIKPEANKIARSKNQSTALSLIKSSQLICVFGMALGKTDDLWWKSLKKWIDANQKNILVVYLWEQNYDPLLIEVSNPTFKNKQNEIFNILGIEEIKQYEERVLICINGEIFNYKLKFHIDELSFA